MKIVSDFLFNRQLRNVAKMAGEGSDKAVSRLYALGSAHRENPDRFDAFIDTGLDLVKKSDALAVALIPDLLDLTRSGDFTSATPTHRLAVLDAGLGVLPGLVQKGHPEASMLIQKLAKPTKGDAARSAALFDMALPLAAQKEGFAASMLLSALTDAVVGDAARSATVADMSLRALSTLPAQFEFGDKDLFAANLLGAAAKAAKGDAVRSAQVVDKGLAILSGMEPDFQAVRVLTTLAYAAKDDTARSAAVVDAGLGLGIVSSYASTNYGESIRLVSTFGKSVKGDADRTAKVIDSGLALFPLLALKGGDADGAKWLVETLTDVAGIETKNGIVCKEFALSAPVGPDKERTLITFGTAPASSVNVPSFREMVVARRGAAAVS